MDDLEVEDNFFTAKSSIGEQSTSIDDTPSDEDWLHFSLSDKSSYSASENSSDSASTETDDFSNPVNEDRQIGALLLVADVVQDLNVNIKVREYLDFLEPTPRRSRKRKRSPELVKEKEFGRYSTSSDDGWSEDDSCEHEVPLSLFDSIFKKYFESTDIGADYPWLSTRDHEYLHDLHHPVEIALSDVALQIRNVADIIEDLTVTICDEIECIDNKIKMASQYKRAQKAQTDPDLSDDEMSDVSSSTVRADSDDDMSDSTSASEEQEEEEVTTNKLKQIPTELRNRILMLTSRGVSFRHRHLLQDLHNLLPHTYLDTKLDTKSSNNYNSALNTLADLHSCNYVFFLEARKQAQDLYLWLAKAPNGPTIKFHVGNVHTMAELGFGGNVLKGGRGTVVFDKSFNEMQTSTGGQENLGLIREMLRGVFCVPSKGVRGMKPFIDRVIGVYALDGKIWIRIYEIREGTKDQAATPEEQKLADGVEAETGVKLVEVGPRFVLTPIVILEGSFGGPVIFENKMYVSPNLVRREVRMKKQGKYAQRTYDKTDRNRKIRDLGLNTGAVKKRGELDDRMLFG